MMGRCRCGSSETPPRLTHLLLLLLLISHSNINNNHHEAYLLAQAFSVSPLVRPCSMLHRPPDRLGLPTARPSVNNIVVVTAVSASTATSSAAASSFQPDTSPAVVRLTQWLDEELDDCDGVGATAIGYNNNNNHRRGLFATEDYAAGEYILAIPTSACLTIYDRVYDMMAEQQDDDDGEIGSSNDREARDIRDGALHLRQLLIKSASSSRQEQQDGPDEPEEKNNFFWQIYLDTLPTDDVTSQCHFDPTPDFWDEDIIRQLEVPQLVTDMLLRKVQQHDHQQEETPSLAFCTWLVRSRAFTTFQMLGNTARYEKEPKQQQLEGDAVAGGGRTLRTRTVLIPYLDMLNHASAGTSTTVMEKIESPVVDVERGGDDDDDYNDNDAGSRRNDDTTSYFALVASQDIAAGDELTVTYGSGHETCLDLFTKYGFWLPNNPNDVNLDCLSLSSSSSVLWSTSLAQDEQALALMQQRLANDDDGQDDDDDDDDGQDDDESLSTRHHDRRRQRHHRSMLELRIHLKRLQQLQLQQP
jgi:hypothetical protein